VFSWGQQTAKSSKLALESPVCVNLEKGKPKKREQVMNGVLHQGVIRKIIREEERVKRKKCGSSLWPTHFLLNPRSCGL
jgi:hypothetical protein